MKRIIIAMALCLAAVVASAAAKEYSVASPDGSLVVKVTTGATVNYSVVKNGVEIIAPSEISMTLSDGTVFGGNARMQKLTKRSVNETFATPVYKKASVQDNFNEITLNFKSFNVVFRAYNEGAAYRFVSKMASDFTVKAEQANFTFAKNWTAYVPYVTKEGSFEKQFFNSFENTYVHHRIGDWDTRKLAFLPITVDADNGMKVCITESDLLDYPGMYLYNGDNSKTLTGVYAPFPKDVQQGGHNMLQGLVQTREDYIAKASAKTSFPWRIVIVAENDKDLLNSDIAYKLGSAPGAGTDWSWIKPGKVAWDWWNDWNIYGVDFKAGINNDTYKYYIDFASKKGIEYVILDEGWAVNKQADLFQIIPEINLEELVAYANSKNVGLILWAGYWAMNRDIEGVCKHFADMGIKGFKVDFMDRDDQQMVEFYYKTAETAAKYHLMVDFHGAFKPSGLHRKFPNVINYEGVHGLEQMKWSDSSVDQVTYDVTIPFVRMVAGPFDYTQGAMRNATKKNYHYVNTEPMSQGTRCRQLAEYVIFEAPFTMLCDSPSNYLAEPECTDFIASIPTTWDETVAVDGKIAEYAAIARRSGNTWYLGALTNWSERDLTLDTSFLPAGNYSVEIYKDGVNADRAARDFAIEKTTLTPGSITIHMAPGGGWVAKFVKK